MIFGLSQLLHLPLMLQIGIEYGVDPGYDHRHPHDKEDSLFGKGSTDHSQDLGGLEELAG
jgi:hypothetical protein